MLARTLSLFDVDDVEAFVQATINRARLILSADERDELVCEGLAIMQRLANGYRPREGEAGAGSKFSGYAAQMLPRKLGDAWHKMHPEHLLVTQPDGRRRWRYEDPSISLDAMVDHEPERHRALQVAEPEANLWSTLRDALHVQARAEAEQAFEFAQLLGEGRSDGEAARILGLRSTEAQACSERIRCVAHRVGLEAA